MARRATPLCCQDWSLFPDVKRTVLLANALRLLQTFSAASHGWGEAEHAWNACLDVDTSSAGCTLEAAKWSLTACWKSGRSRVAFSDVRQRRRCLFDGVVFTPMCRCAAVACNSWMNSRVFCTAQLDTRTSANRGTVRRSRRLPQTERKQQSGNQQRSVGQIGGELLF